MTVSNLEEYRRAAHRALDDAIDRLQRRGLSAAPSPEDLIEYGIFARPAEHPLARAVGPVYDARGVGRVTGLRRQQLDDRRKRGTILALHTRDGAWVYPVFQFDASGAVKPLIRAVLGVFRHRDIDPWTVAVWLNTPKPGLGDEAPSGGEASRDRVLELAQQDAARWAA